MNIKKVCKNVGYDGKEYFCMLCGKAGFTKEEQAIGHLAKCKARKTKKSELPDSSQLQASYKLADLPDNLPTEPPSSTSNIERLLAVQGQQIADIRNEQAKLSNEATHLMAVNNQSSFDFNSKGLLLLVIVGVMAYFLGRENCSCDYSMSGTTKKTKGNGFWYSAGMKTFGKVLDKVL
jgi:hypothetical protein